jgi:hypothetical protein
MSGCCVDVDLWWSLHVPLPEITHLETAKAAIEMTGLTQRPGGKLWLIAAGIAVVVIVIVLIAAYGGGGSGGGGGGY